MPADRFGRIVILLICLGSPGFAAASDRPPHVSTSVHGLAISRSAGTSPMLRPPPGKRLAADRDPYPDLGSPYMAHRLSGQRSEPPLNTPGQSTVLTRQVLDDMNATSLRDALRSTAGVTVGR